MRLHLSWLRTNHGLTPSATLDGSNCTLAGPDVWQLYLRDAGSLRRGWNFAAAGADTHSRTLRLLLPLTAHPLLAPYSTRSRDTCNSSISIFNVSCQLASFADIAYAGAHGVHLQQYSTNVNQIPDSFVATAAAQFAAGQTTRTIAQPLGATNPMARNLRIPRSALPQLSLDSSDRPYPQYTGLESGADMDAVAAPTIRCRLP